MEAFMAGFMGTMGVVGALSSLLVIAYVAFLLLGALVDSVGESWWPRREQ